MELSFDLKTCFCARYSSNFLHNILVAFLDFWLDLDDYTDQVTHDINITVLHNYVIMRSCNKLRTIGCLYLYLKFIYLLLLLLQN